jgi:hypothetical protein
MESSYPFLASGLTARAGDTILMTISAASDYDSWYGTTDIRGVVTGLNPQFAECRNSVSGTTIRIPVADEAAWNCSTSGLPVSSRGEQIFIPVVGVAR